MYLVLTFVNKWYKIFQNVMVLTELSREAAIRHYAPVFRMRRIICYFRFCTGKLSLFSKCTRAPVYSFQTRRGNQAAMVGRLFIDRDLYWLYPGMISWKTRGSSVMMLILDTLRLVPRMFYNENKCLVMGVTTLFWGI